MNDILNTHLIIEEGPDKGRRCSIPSDGARIGRSVGNDIQLTDPALSRFHCRLYFKPDGQLWAADLGSTNQTMVNGNPVEDIRLSVGDRIEIGETVLKVVWDRIEPQPEPAPVPGVDLGLGRTEVAARPPIPWKKLGAGVAVILLVAALVWVFIMHSPSTPEAVAAGYHLEIRYEKVLASSTNIFRYALALEDRTLTIRIDDLASGRHVSKEKEALPATILQSLTHDLEASGFFDLQTEYAGLTDDLYDRLECDVSVGRRAHRVVVLNRVEPEGFRRARELIEEFGRNELALAALALAPDELRQLADESFLRGQKLFDEREVRTENLYRAIQSLEEAEWYLETIEPKPDSYARIVAALAECRRHLQERYEDHMFRAERAIRLREWPEAARELRILTDLIPDRSDERYEKVRKKLLDVERRITR